MNALNCMTLLLLFLRLAAALSVADNFGDGDGDDYAPAPSPSFIEIPEPPQKPVLPVTGDYSKDKELVECVKKITPRCGDAVFFYVYMGEAYPSRYCCQKLVNTGRRCHDRMIERIAKAVPKYHDRIVFDPRNDKLWSYCLTGAPASSPSS